MDSWQKGQIARLKVELRAMEKNVAVSVPTTDNTRYDLVVDWCGKLYRAQVKYAGGIATYVQGVAVVSLTKGDRGERRYTSNEIDALLVYIPTTDQICWFGPGIFHGKTQIYIRYQPCKNNQQRGCVMLEQYVW